MCNEEENVYGKYGRGLKGDVFSRRVGFFMIRIRIVIIYLFVGSVAYNVSM